MSFNIYFTILMNINEACNTIYNDLYYTQMAKRYHVSFFVIYHQDGRMKKLQNPH